MKTRAPISNSNYTITFLIASLTGRLRIEPGPPLFYEAERKTNRRTKNNFVVLESKSFAGSDGP